MVVEVRSGRALAVGQDLRHVEHLQTADHRGDHHIHEDGPDEGQW